MTTISGGLPTLTNNNSTEDPITRSLLSEIKSAHNTDHAAGAHALSWLATGSSGQIIVGDGSGVATWRTGTNFTMSSAGALTAVTDTALSSPNNSTYRTLLTKNVRVPGGTTSASYFVNEAGAITASGAALSGSAVLLNLTGTDYAVSGGLTPKIRIRAYLSRNGTAVGTNVAVKLSSFTSAGGAGAFTPTWSSDAYTITVVSGGSQGISGDAAVVDGTYALTVAPSGTVAAGCEAVFHIVVDQRAT